jgi:hypothetical protein
MFDRNKILTNHGDFEKQRKMKENVQVCLIELLKLQHQPKLS